MTEHTKFPQPISWAGTLANSVLATYPDPRDLHSHHPGEWCYQNGFFMNALFALWQRARQQNYWQYILNWVDVFVNNEGVFDQTKYKREEYNLDNILPGRLLISLYQESEKYKKAAWYLMEQLKEQPRTSEGGYWHKQIYPYQMWLDGIYMAEPFSVEFARTFDEPQYFDEAVLQITLIHNHTHDPKTGLLYHGWDETKTQIWAHLERGTSPEFWGRAIGWYIMALVDCLDSLPENHAGRDKIVAILQNLAASITNYQDPNTGLWYQVLDKGDRPDNWHETSCTAMFAYAFAKGVRKGYLDPGFRDKAETAYQGLLDRYVYLDEDNHFYLTDTVSIGSLRSKADYAYYVTTERRTNDFKGIAAFLYASLEMEMEK
jgi:unsaturated rhamnogalacturonyl hydrolase